MAMLSIVALILVGLVVVIALWLVAVYNGLIRLRNQVDEGWSDIDVQLKRRHDLIPNLVESVKGYLKHEKELLENITTARSQAMSAQAAGNRTELAKAEGMLGGLLGNLRIAMEAYPDLKANQTMAQLMDELSDTENKILAARRFYNGVVRDFNTKIQVFPNNVVAGMLGFTAREFFEIEDAAERKNVQVKF
ncbi:MAG: LemA family protein [Candidatus Kerfeldbacteria bacterium]|nr:LemA family protein [Candidatus Kerfeldbacteria bacterium]